MIRNTRHDLNSVAAVICRVRNRWYVCSEAEYEFNVAIRNYTYTTPTLKFKYDVFYHGYSYSVTSSINGDPMTIEFLGHKNSLKLEYVW